MSDLPLPTQAAETLREQAPIYAAAKANRIREEGMLKAKKAVLMIASLQKSVAAKEMEAHASPIYAEAVEAISAAAYTETLASGLITAAEAEIEVWRTQSANNRMIDRTHR